MGNICGTRDVEAGNVNTKNQLLQREWQEIKSETQTGVSVRVLHWNVLAQQLSDAFPKVAPEYLTWEHRKPLFEQEFFKTRPNGNPFWDVICLQEADLHADLIEKQGCYAGGCKKNNGKWMCGIYYNKMKFEQKDRTEDTYKNVDGSSMSQVWIGICLQEKKSGANFWVYTTHLKAKGPFAQVRKAQVEQLLPIVTKNPSLPMIITGDFNDVPSSEALAPFQNSELKSASVAWDKKQLDFTTHKWREVTGIQTRTIDYVWFQDSSIPGNYGVKVVGNYRMPERQTLPETGFPSKDHPSDHLAMGYEFQVFYNNSKKI